MRQHTHTCRHTHVHRHTHKKNYSKNHFCLLEYTAKLIWSLEKYLLKQILKQCHGAF